MPAIRRGYFRPKQTLLASPNRLLGERRNLRKLGPFAQDRARRRTSSAPGAAIGFRPFEEGDEVGNSDGLDGGAKALWVAYQGAKVM